MATMFIDPEKFRTGVNPLQGGGVYQGGPIERERIVGPNPAPTVTNINPGTPTRGPLASYVPQFDRGNRDAFLKAISDFRTNAGSVGYSNSEIDDYFNNNLAGDWNNTQRGFYTGEGQKLVRDALRSRLGARYDQFSPDIESELTNYAYMQRPDIDKASGDDIVNIPQRLFGAGATSTILGALNNRVRGKAMGDFQNAFKTKPTQEIGDDADDSVINKIVEEQYGSAREGIDRQVKRGALNDFGKNKAFQALDARRGQVSTRLQDRGKGLLDTLRQRAQGIYNDAERAASGANVDSPFDVNNFSSQYRSAIDSGKAGLEGGIRDLVSPDEFNLQEVLGGSYSAQGPTNKNAPILAAIEARNKVRSANRGLGTVGAF